MINLITETCQPFPQIEEEEMQTDYIQREFLGKNIDVRVKHKGKKIVSLTTRDFSPKWTANPEWIEVKASKRELQNIEEELL